MDFDRLKGNKVAKNITIDKALFDKLEEIKEEKGIDTLSPLINEMPRDWLIKNGY